ncbi:MAG: hypothetical protein CVV64_13295 [Candidatus Wallbacteria bacterium HGW-Wallbacteria-1]|uniref:Uncharacterized protein n=1 Tax=Candidatus Wallbacteria bacterium HGW-Wallbacteria-1 TaxID=2013854 RepID=A0A2N1PMV7_9BACT|nr:MAG: hypothetical protein CVV64_13295 [Candidatus Wallbacteria bacterium HGW-Wallbacteria-1]
MIEPWVIFLASILELWLLSPESMMPSSTAFVVPDVTVNHVTANPVAANRVTVNRVTVKSGPVDENADYISQGAGKSTDEGAGIPVISSDAIMRRMRIRASALGNTGKWPEAAAILASLRSARCSGNFHGARVAGTTVRVQASDSLIKPDPGLDLDYADAVSRTSGWSEAGLIYNSIWENRSQSETPFTPAHRERALEARRALRETRGTMIRSTLGRTDSQGEGRIDWESRVRWQTSSRTRVEARWSEQDLGDYANAPSIQFEKDMDNYNLSLIRKISPVMEVGLGYGKVRGHVLDENSLDAQIRYQSPSGVSFSLNYSDDRPWIEPIDAALFDGLVSEGSISWFRPLNNSWFMGADATWRDYSLGVGETWFGRDRRFSVSLGREVFRTHYGARNPIRYINLSVAREFYDSEQDSLLAPLITLVDKTRTTTLNLFAHLIMARRATLDISAFAGHDPDRGLRIGRMDLYGFSADFRLDMDSLATLFLRGSVSTENPANLLGGKSGTLYGGLEINID